jgi:flagellar hook-length control protein FliK
LAANATPQQTNAVTAAPTHDTSPGPAQQIDPALRSAPVQIVQAAIQPEAPPPTTEPVEPQPAGRRAPVSPVPQQTIVTGQSAADAAAAAPPPVTASPAPVRPATRAPGASAPVRAAATVQGDDAKQVPVQAVGSEKGEGSAVTVSRAPDVQEAPARPVNPAVARAVQVDSAVQLLNSAILAAPGGEAAPAVPNAAALSLGTVAEQADSAGNTNQPLTDAKAAVESGPPSKIVRGLMTMLNQRGGVMNMRLQPAELGDLQVRMSIVRGSVSAEFIVSTRQAHAVLDGNLATLRTALESQGLAVERLSIHTQAQHGHAFATDDEGDRQDSRDDRDEHRDDDAGRHAGRDEREAHHESNAARARPVFADDLDRLAEAITGAA